MEAVRQQSPDLGTNVTEYPIIDSNWRTQPSYTVEEFMDRLAKKWGKHFGLADIRDAK